MNQRSKYKTKHRKVMLEYFERVSGTHITANDVCEYFKKKGTPIGQSTVYRQLESLVDEGIISKYIIDGNSPACFEYTGSVVPEDKDVCFHCKCEKCGALIHLHCNELVQIQAHLYEEHQFRLNPMRTVFYGTCNRCL